MQSQNYTVYATALFRLGGNETHWVVSKTVRMYLLRFSTGGTSSRWTLGWKAYLVQPDRMSTTEASPNSSDAGSCLVAPGLEEACRGTKA